jgi:hypothetical protein
MVHGHRGIAEISLVLLVIGKLEVVINRKELVPMMKFLLLLSKPDWFLINSLTKQEMTLYA